jgi:soluble lytic murein transglycosylase-like protein
MAWVNPNLQKIIPIVSAESDGLPPDLVMSVIKHESGGITGRESGLRTADATPFIRRDGSTITPRRAYGLMQCIGAVVADYNRSNDGTVYYEEISGTTEQDAIKQVRVGVWLLNKYRGRLAARYPQFTDMDSETIRMILLAYARGYGGLTRKLDTLKQEGKPLTFDALKVRFPDWGGGVEFPFRGVEKKYSDYIAHFGDVQEAQSGIITLPTTEVSVKKNSIVPWVLLTVAAGLLIAYLRGRK